MKLEDATNNPQIRAFVNDGKLHLSASHNDGKITQFYLNSGAVWNESNGSYSYDFSSYSTLTLIGNGQAWVGHDAAGNCYLSIQGNSSFGQLGSAQVNSGFWLPAIPRASTPSWSGDFEAGTAKTINMNRASTGFTHTVQYSFGSVGMTTIATGVTDNVSWTPPLSLLQQIPNSGYRDWETDRKSTRLNSSHRSLSRMPSSA